MEGDEYKSSDKAADLWSRIVRFMLEVPAMLLKLGGGSWSSCCDAAPGEPSCSFASMLFILTAAAVVSEGADVGDGAVAGTVVFMFVEEEGLISSGTTALSVPEDGSSCAPLVDDMEIEGGTTGTTGSCCDSPCAAWTCLSVDPSAADCVSTGLGMVKSLCRKENVMECKVRGHSPRHEELHGCLYTRS